MRNEVLQWHEKKNEDPVNGTRICKNDGSALGIAEKDQAERAEAVRDSLGPCRPQPMSRPAEDSSLSTGDDSTIGKQVVIRTR